MKISYKWLKHYLDIDLSPEQLEQNLTFAGIEVEAVEKLGQELSQIIISEIKEKKQHPNAEKLSVCTVFNGTEEVQVVCGAPNCAAGQKVALAPVGAKIGDFKIKKAKLRGEASFGMLCSEKELEISNNHDGIMVLAEDATVGLPLNEYLGFDDTVYEVEITPNRPDLLGMLGVAKDLAALLSKKASNPYLKELPKATKSAELTIENKEPELCPRYTGTVIKNVKIEPSPKWLIDCITAAGLRPINNIVDITNFVMMEYGHPLHAFDLSKLASNKIVIRKADKDEEFSALDDNTYKLTENDLVIADEQKAIALAGVIGGANSEIDENTTDIILEAACFTYSTVRKTSRHHKIFTDSAYRFERGMSAEKAMLVAERAAQLIIELAGGELATDFIDSYPVKQSKAVVDLRLKRIKRLLNIELSAGQVKKYLLPLGLEVNNESYDLISFLAPFDRPDLTREIDLLEELMRLYGYNNFPKKAEKPAIMDKKAFYAMRDVQDVMVAYGFYEAYNLSYSDPNQLDLLKLEEDCELKDTVNIMNPMGTSFSVLRSSLLPGLLKNLAHNINHGEKDVKLFETAKVFRRNNQKLATEEKKLTAVISGLKSPLYWQNKPEQSDFYLAKGAIEGILEKLNITIVKWKHYSNSYMLEGQSAAVYFKKQLLGFCGKLDPKIAESFEIDAPVWVIELNLDAVLNLGYTNEVTFAEIPKKQLIQRDISFVVNCTHSVEEISKSIIATNPKLIKSVNLFDEYKGKGIPKQSRSLSFKLFIGSDTKTLTDEFILQLFGKVQANLEKTYQIQMR